MCFKSIVTLRALYRFRASVHMFMTDSCLFIYLFIYLDLYLEFTLTKKTQRDTVYMTAVFN